MTRARSSLPSAAALSLVVHVSVFAALLHGRGAAPPSPRPRPTQLRWVHTEPPRPLPAPEPAKAPPDKPAAAVPSPKRKVPVRKRRRAATKPAPPREAPPAQEPAAVEPLDFSGLTLTNASNSGWRSATGSGAPIQGPIGAPGTRGSARGVPDTRAASARKAGPRVVAAGDLSRAPQPPPLDDRLRELYPETARRAGREGEARLAARVLPSGRVGRLRVLRASGKEFADACLELLRSSRWSPPLDDDGQAVATDVVYRCEFLVD